MKLILDPDWINISGVSYALKSAPLNNCSLLNCKSFSKQSSVLEPTSSLDTVYGNKNDIQPAFNWVFNYCVKLMSWIITMWEAYSQFETHFLIYNI